MNFFLQLLIISSILTTQVYGCIPGATTPVGSPVVQAPGSAPRAVAYSPNGNFLAVANEGDDTVSVYSVSPVGILSQVPGSPFATGSQPVSLSYSADSKCLAVANYGDNTLSLFSADEMGILTVIDPSFLVGQNPTSVSYDSNNYLAVTLEGDSQIAVYLKLASCGLSLVSTYPVGNQPAAVSYSRGSRFVAIANSGDNTITVFKTNTLGELTLVNTYPTGANPIALSYSNTGFLAVVHETDNTLTMFQVDATTGGLTDIGTYLTGSMPNGVSFSPDGTNLLVTNGNDGTIIIYTVDSNGALTQFSTQVISTSPINGAVYSPRGNFIAVPDTFNDAITPFTYTQLPLTVITADKALILPGTEVVLTANILQGQAPYTLEWSFTYVNSSGQNVIDFFVEFNVVGSINRIAINPTVDTAVSLRIVDALGCTSFATGVQIGVRKASPIVHATILKYC